jgi:hypothetical protein
MEPSWFSFTLNTHLSPQYSTLLGTGYDREGLVLVKTLHLFSYSFTPLEMMWVFFRGGLTICLGYIGLLTFGLGHGVTKEGLCVLEVETSSTHHGQRS